MADTTNQDNNPEGSPEPEEGGAPADQTGGEPAEGGDSGGEDDYEPEVRQKPWSNREERAEFFKKKHKEEVPEVPEDDDKVRSLVNEAIGSVLDEKLGKFAESQDEVLVKNEINSFLTENPDMRKHAKRVEKAAKVYANVPVSQLFKMLAYDDAFAQGAEHKGTVDRKLAKNKIAGAAKRQQGNSLPDFKSMTPDELEEYNASLPRGGVKVEG